MPKKKAVKPPKPPKPEPPAPTPFWPEYWFIDGLSSITLGNRIGVAGPSPRVEVRIDRDTLKMTFRVRATPGTITTLDDEPPVNESHTHPPD